MRLLNTKGQILAGRKATPGHVTCKTMKTRRCCFGAKDRQTTLLDLKLPALDLAGSRLPALRDSASSSLCFGPRDLYRPGETVILNALLRDGDGKPLAEPVKFEVVRRMVRVIRSLVGKRLAQRSVSFTAA